MGHSEEIRGGVTAAAAGGVGGGGGGAGMAEGAGEGVAAAAAAGDGRRPRMSSGSYSTKVLLFSSPEGAAVGVRP